MTVQGGDEGDTTTIQKTLPEAAEQLEAVAAVTDDAVAVIEEVVADKGYHSRTTVRDLETLAIRTYISEPDRGPQSWIDQDAERDAVYANRRRIRGTRGKRLLRRRGELLERPCAHLYETGGLRRAHVRGHEMYSNVCLFMPARSGRHLTTKRHRTSDFAPPNQSHEEPDLHDGLLAAQRYRSSVDHTTPSECAVTISFRFCVEPSSCVVSPGEHRFRLTNRLAYPRPGRMRRPS